MGAESRIVFAIPRHEMVIVGTTDTDFNLDPAQVRTETDDVDYLLKVIAQYFPGMKISAKDIVGCYAGVRPLIDDGAATESKTSREHAIWTESHGVTFVAGGKYTTYRNMAEQTVHEVLRHLPIEDRVRYGITRTLQPLNPLIDENLWPRAIGESAQWTAGTQVPAKVARILAERHGFEGRRIMWNALAVIPESMNPEEWLWCAEALHAVEETMCVHLSDFYFRRTPLVLSRRDHGIPFAAAIAKVMGEPLGWDKTKQLEEINALQNQLSWELSATISS